MPVSTEPHPARTSRAAWRQLAAVVVGFRGEKLALRAGNLTFITLTSLVPLAAVVLALLHWFGSSEVERLVLKFFEELLSPGGRAQAERALKEFKTAADSRTGSTLSFLVLLASSGVLLRHLDASLNDVWAVRKKRPLLTTLWLYLGVLVMGPLAMGLSLLGSDGIKRLLVYVHFPWWSAAFTAGAMAWAMVVFALLYKLAPHAPVRWRSALYGGAAAGLAWEFARRLYGSIVSFFFSANAVYGSLGVAPLFLTWLYVSWYIILCGARLAYALEHAAFHDAFPDLLAHPRSDELIATRVAQVLSRASVMQRPPPTIAALAQVLRLPAQRVQDAVFRLEAAALVQRHAFAVVPARPLDQLTVADISFAVGGAARTLHRDGESQTGPFDGAAQVFNSADEVSVEKLRKVTWADLAVLAEPETKS